MLTGLFIILFLSSRNNGSSTNNDGPSFKEQYPGSGFVGCEDLHANFLAGEEFNGEFNGNGHEIGNATFIVNGDSGGLFNDIGKDGVVYNLRIKNIELFGDAVTGVIAGENKGLIGYVRVSESMIVGGEIAGSFVGINRGGVIGRCISEGCIVSGEKIVGGFSGGNNGYIHESEAVDVKSESTGEIKKVCGGFLGVNWKTSLVADCRAEGQVIVDETDDVKISTGEFVGVNGSMASKHNAGVLLHNFASVKGCRYGITSLSQFPILNCYYNKTLCHEGSYYTATWRHTLPTRGLTESEMTGEDALSTMDWLDENIWENSDEYPRQKALNRLDTYWNLSSERASDLLTDPIDVSWLKSLEKWAEDLHKKALDSPAATNEIPESARSGSTSKSKISSSRRNENSTGSSSVSEKVPIKSTGGFLSPDTTIGYIEGNKIRGAGGLLTRGEIVAELHGDTVRDTSGLLRKGDRIAKIDDHIVRDIGGLLSSGDILAVIDGNNIRDEGGIFSSGDLLAEVDGDATQEQKGAAAAAIVLGKINE